MPCPAYVARYVPCKVCLLVRLVVEANWGLRLCALSQMGSALKLKGIESILPVGPKVLLCQQGGTYCKFLVRHERMFVLTTGTDRPCMFSGSYED